MLKLNNPKINDMYRKLNEGWRKWGKPASELSPIKKENNNERTNENKSKRSN